MSTKSRELFSCHEVCLSLPCSIFRVAFSRLILHRCGRDSAPSDEHAGECLISFLYEYLGIKKRVQSITYVKLNCVSVCRQGGQPVRCSSLHHHHPLQWCLWLLFCRVPHHQGKGVPPCSASTWNHLPDGYLSWLHLADTKWWTTRWTVYDFMPS